MKRRFQFALGALLTLFLAPSALAHPMKGVGDFYAGMLHPVVTIDALLPVIGLGLMAGQQHRETAIKILVAFPAAILAGTTLILFRSGPRFLSITELIITAIFGMLIALGKPLPSAVTVSLAVVLGLAVGWTNASEITSDMSPVRFLAGVAVAGLLLTTYGLGLVRQLKFDWSQIALRVVGSWLAAIGILVLGLR